MRKTLMAAAAACALIFSAVCTAPAQSKKTLQVESGLVDAVALFDAGQFKEASALLKVLMGADPANDAVRYYLGLSAVALRDYDTAAEQLREAVRLDPSNYWYRDRLARLYTSTGQPELAIDIYLGYAAYRFFKNRAAV